MGARLSWCEINVCEKVNESKIRWAHFMLWFDFFSPVKSNKVGNYKSDVKTYIYRRDRE